MIQHFQCAVLVLDGLQSHSHDRVVRRRRRATTVRPPLLDSTSTGSYVAPVTVICADFAVSGGPVRSFVVFVVFVTGYATSHTFNTYINTQQLPPPPLLLWIATTEVPTTYYRTLSTNHWVLYSYYEYNHWLPCDGSVTIAGARSEHYCCNGDRRRRSAHQMFCVTSVATSETALSPLAGRQGTVGSLFVHRLFHHLSPTTSDGGGGDQWCIRTHIGKPEAAHGWCTPYSVRSSPSSCYHPVAWISRRGIAAIDQWAQCAR